MLISKDAVSNYLNKELRDLAVLKECSRKAMLRLIEKLPVKTEFKSPYKPWLHQLWCYYAGLCLDGFIMVMDPGLGKTRTCLDIFATRKREGVVRKAIVLTVNELNVDTWVDDAAKHRPDVKVVPLCGNFEQRWEQRERDADCYVISYTSLLYTIGREVRKKNVASEELVERMMEEVDLIVFDEIHLCKSWKSQTYQFSLKLAQKAAYRLGCTGTLFGRNAEDVWTQFYLVDRGETFGGTLGMFRAGFFDEKIGWGGWRVRKFRKKMEGTFKKFLRNRSISVLDTEAGGMPLRRREIIPLAASQMQKEYFFKIRQAALKAKLTKEKVESTYVRLRMVSSGFITLKGEDTGKVEIELKDNPKLKYLDLFVERMPMDKKGVIVHEFVYSGILICNQLKKLGASFVHLRGGLSKQEKRKMVRDFKKEVGGPQFLVMNWRSGGTGLNFQISNYMHFYETPVSPIIRKQVEGRVRRRDSKHKRIFYTDAVIKDSVEEKVLEYLKEGQDFSKAVLGNPQILFGEEYNEQTQGELELE